MKTHIICLLVSTWLATYNVESMELIPPKIINNRTFQPHEIKTIVSFIHSKWKQEKENEKESSAEDVWTYCIALETQKFYEQNTTHKETTAARSPKNSSRRGSRTAS